MAVRGLPSNKMFRCKGYRAINRLFRSDGFCETLILGFDILYLSMPPCLHASILVSDLFVSRNTNSHVKSHVNSHVHLVCYQNSDLI